jgi:light-regulated signal transduction histidine kinase (bacteriophytochrome)
LHKQPRIQLSEDELKAALDNCAAEPIHIPGSIQPHGFLIACTAGDDIICRASGNVHEYTGFKAEEIIGKPIDFILGEEAQTLRPLRGKGPLEPLQSFVVTLNGKKFDAVTNRASDSVNIIEFEPQPEGDEEYNKFQYERLRRFAINVREAGTEQKLFNLIVNEIFDLTGIDRVKLYRFDSDWNGEVIAEAKTDYMPTYLGLHFPASDIPEQARALYTKNYLRIIPDISYRPVPIVPNCGPSGGEQLDMSQSMLRSVSPVHIQYLDNMNVRASLSISIIQNGKLWGLIACHHNSPLYIPYRTRMIAEVIGHIFSAQLSSLHELEKTSDNQKRTLLLEKLTIAIQQSQNLNTLFIMIAPLSMAALKSGGVALHTNGQNFTFGDTPDNATLTSLFHELKKEDINDVIYTEDAQDWGRERNGILNLEGGFLAARVTRVGGDMAVWFRPSIVREVKWAGKPEKTAEETMAGYRLTPRSSFTLWQENARARSLAWSVDDIQTALNVVKIFIESKQVTADQANLAKSEFMANLSHELRTPMNAVIGLADILGRSQPLTEKQRMYLTTLRGSADNLLALINDLLDVSKIEAGSVDLEMIEFDLPALAQEIIDMMSVQASQKRLQLTLDTDELKNNIYCGEPTRLRQILVNLVGNAVKFTDHGQVVLKISSLSHSSNSDLVTFEVTDTGIGIPADKLGSVFEKFTQADASISRKFGGTGLGLAITKMLVELLNGQITVKSTVGQGSVFAFTLPMEIA